ncbi:MAG: LysR family transcriptional regulator [Succinivibrio sp.]
MPSVIEIGFLRQLLAFAESGTLSAASEKLFISQPALTRSMQKLEEQMGVPLFVRRKNRLCLNENGKLAASLSRRVIEADEDLVAQVRSHDRKLRTVSLGCCAPVPMIEITPCVQAAFTDKTVTSEVGDDPKLLKGLEEGAYQLVVIHDEPEDDGIYFKSCGSEQLYLSVPLEHPLARKDTLCLADLAGTSVLQYSEIGFWHEVTARCIPDPHILLQHNRKAFVEIANSSVLPTFLTDYFFYISRRSEQPAFFSGYLQPGGGIPFARKIIRFTDEICHPCYYLACRSRERERWRGVFESLPRWCVQSLSFKGPDCLTVGAGGRPDVRL